MTRVEMVTPTGTDWNPNFGPQPLQVSIWRGDGSGVDFANLEVPAQSSQTALDVVAWLQQYARLTLS